MTTSDPTESTSLPMMNQRQKLVRPTKLSNVRYHGGFCLTYPE